MKELYALTILRIIHLRFNTRDGKNPDMCSLQNRNGNTIYIQKFDDYVEINVFKVSARCCNFKIFDVSEIEKAVNEIKQKIETDDYEYINK